MMARYTPDIEDYIGMAGGIPLSGEGYADQYAIPLPGQMAPQAAPPVAPPDLLKRARLLQAARHIASQPQAPLQAPAPQMPQSPYQVSAPLQPALSGPVTGPDMAPGEDVPPSEDGEGFDHARLGYALGSGLGGAGAAFSKLGRVGRRQQHEGGRDAQRLFDRHMGQQREDEKTIQAQAKEGALKAREAAMNDPASQQSQSMQAAHREMFQSAGLNSADYSANQINHILKNPMQLQSAARQMEKDRIASEGRAETSRANLAEGDSGSPKSRRQRDRFRAMFKRMGHDPTIISEDMSYADMMNADGVVQQTLGLKKARYAGGLGDRRGGGAATTPTGTLDTSPEGIETGGKLTGKLANARKFFPDGYRDDPELNAELLAADKMGPKDQEKFLISLERRGIKMKADVKEFARDMQKSDIPKTRQLEKRLVNAIRGARAKNNGEIFRGFDEAWRRGPKMFQGMMSQHAKDVDIALQAFKNAEIKDKAGATVTVSEMPRVAAAMDAGIFGDESDIERFVAALRADLEAVENSWKAGYGADVARAYHNGLKGAEAHPDAPAGMEFD